MIRMTCITNGQKTDLAFDTVEELEEFNARRTRRLEEEAAERTRLAEREREEAEKKLREGRQSVRTAFAKAFLLARDAGFDPDGIFDLMAEVLSDLANGKDVGKDGPEPKDGDRCKDRSGDCGKFPD